MDEYSELLTGPSSNIAYMILEAHEKSQNGRNAGSGIFLPALLEAHHVTPLPEPLIAAFMLYACGPDNHEEALQQFHDYSGHIDDLDVNETYDWFQEVLDFEDAIADVDLTDQPFEFQIIYVALQEQYYRDRLNDIGSQNQQFHENLMQQINQTIELLDTLDDEALGSRPGTEVLALLRQNVDYLKDVQNNNSLKNTFNWLDKKHDHLGADDGFSFDSGPSEEDMEQLGLILNSEISETAWDVVETYPETDNDDLFDSIVPALLRLDETEGAPEALVAAMLLFSVNPEDRKSAITDYCERFHETEPEAVNETLDYCEQLQSFFDDIEEGSLKGQPPVLQLYYLAQQDVYFEKRIEQGRLTQPDCVKALSDTAKVLETLDEDVQETNLCRANLEKMTSIVDAINQSIEVKKTTERLKGDFKSYKKNNGRSKDGFRF